MKLFALVAGALGLAHAAEDAADAFQSVSEADVRIWKTDVVHAESTMKSIKNSKCKLPKGKKLASIGTPVSVQKRFNRLSNGNTRGTYQFKFRDGSLVFAANNNVGMHGGQWRIYCYRQGHDIATRSPHHNDLSTSMTARLKKAFNAMDRDGSGKITSGGAYGALNGIFNPANIPNFEDTLDKETVRAAGKDRRIDFDEFECVAQKLYNIQKVYAEFKQYDTNHDLKMDRRELENALIKYYFKDVVAPGFIQTAIVKAKVKGIVDNIIKKHDKDHDSKVTFKEFETDAFAEEHYYLGAKCKAASKPLNKHELSVISNLIKKFRKGGTKELSHSQWYQITSLLTAQSIDKMKGGDKKVALGCMKKGGSSAISKYFGANGGSHFGKGKGSGSGSGRGGRDRGGGGGGGGPRTVEGRVLLRRFLQFGGGADSGFGRGGGDGGFGRNPRKDRTKKPHGKKHEHTTRKGSKTHVTKSKADKEKRKELMSLRQALAVLHKQADTNHDGHISDHEIVDIFQGVRDHLSTSDFGSFMDMVNKIKGPIDCGQFKDCGKCTVAGNAGLCGWVGASRRHDPFGGFTSGGSGGNCKFVDRTRSAEAFKKGDGGDTAKETTCSNQCGKKKGKGSGGKKKGSGHGSGHGGHGSGHGGRGSGRGGSSGRGGFGGGGGGFRGGMAGGR